MSTTYVARYIAPEPTAVEGFLDSRGQFHKTREDAITADFERELAAIIQEHFHASDTTFREALESIAAEHPDMLRILVGDRDMT